MKRILIIDNYDSFVYNIYQYVASMGVDVKILENDMISPEKSDYDGIIISPGPGNPKNIEDRGKLYEFIDNNRHKKFLGICFGHQTLAYYLGSDIRLSKRIMHGQIDAIKHSEGIIYNGIPETFNAIRYHSLVVTENSNIIVDAVSITDGEIMGFHSRDNHFFGVQFHPESYYTNDGYRVLKNFIDAV
ncbi:MULTISPECIES: aminodeoxychorismate/anthranilate synthase component II [Acidiplasma]|jgi:anthranilate synthase component 2|uniref:anthranilate synthase n=2 Tax=Acidiplasma TaxID=507753 RepID=A0A0Q0VQF9_9ARCH|nr:MULTISPECIES: aminodeoxychorismate/anthranilate synthase component II [Acidiplasma]KJE49054.1 anthranilate synthase [Acidiplasma sp. MBA-1]KPV47168.1 anthranilate synthase [Acidiplasma aeolicum]KQB34439.1 anthranilate synthase [Acidiplasma aeolicum]KQB36073.1 anthranilate synthase [Acidiplasma cupricumulans]WMT54501.1 MAG: aminodeoxychorismate/anthranilate synthase component II [Acidiplasma sp.]